MSSDWRTIKLDRGDHGVRVDRVLLRHLRDEKGASRNRIQKWIDAGDVLINGAAASRAAWRVQAGDELRVQAAAADATRPGRMRESIAFEILYEDDDLLAVNKPAGLVVHPSFRNTTGTLINGLLEHARDVARGIDAGAARPARQAHLRHRASSPSAREIHAALQRAMDARRVDKDYLAIVWGKPTPLRGTIDLALDRDPWDRRRITVTDRGGQPSVTRYERLSTTGEFSLVRCRLITGRTHQIRVHLSAKKWPIVGDAAYGPKADRRQRRRQRRSSFRDRHSIPGGSHFASHEPGVSSQSKRRCPTT